jgi:predicted RNA-binding Zn-ribbon protein involved in translation (DUF1610 family)
MSAVQKFLLALMPASWRASAEAESKQWMMQCPNCQFEQSYWDTGGIRWKAAGNPRLRRKCPNCGETVWFRVYKKG